jgi:DNA-binding PadR family transcriptional regulator
MQRSAQVPTHISNQTQRNTNDMHATLPRHGRRWRHRVRDHELHGLHRFFQHGRGGRAVRRGNVRFAILSVLRDEPMHGYQVIQELESRTQGKWRPSAGSVYPTLQLLEDEGLLTSQEVDGRRTYSLTDAGREAADEHPMTAEGWLGADAEGDRDNLGNQLRSVAQASTQIQRIGTPEMRSAARDILVDARKRLYRLLADDDEGAQD